MPFSRRSCEEQHDSVLGRRADTLLPLPTNEIVDLLTSIFLTNLKHTRASRLPAFDEPERNGISNATSIKNPRTQIVVETD
jgi:hypothetical protein